MTSSYPPDKSYFIQIAQTLTHSTLVDYMDLASSKNDGLVQNNPDTGGYGTANCYMCYGLYYTNT